MGRTPRTARWEFGKFELIPEQRLLLADGIPVPLTSKAFDTLVLLIENRDRVVTKDEILRVVWPDVIVEEGNLTQQIFLLRKAFGESAQQPRYIATVPGHGYRFTAPVNKIPRGSEADTGAPAGSGIAPAPAVELPLAQPASTPKAAPRVWPRTAVVGGAGLVLAVVAIGSFRMTARPPRPRVGSVAVLPFANLLGDRNLDYLVEGLADTVNTELGRAGVARVIASGSTNRYRDHPRPPKDIARELRVEALVRASVVRNGASYAVNVQLVDSATERQMWTGRFERATVGDLTVADDIAAGLIRELGLPAPAVSKSPARPIALEARKEFATGRYFWDQRTEPGLEKAVVHLSRAIQLQPDYAEAWSALADAYAMDAKTPSSALTPWPNDRIAAGTAAARRAIQLDPTLGHPHAALGRFLLDQRRWQESEVEHREAVTLSPQYSTGRQWYGTLLGRLGKCEEALKQAQIGADIDPLTPLVNEGVASVHLMCRQPARAIPILRRVLDMYPDLLTSINRLGTAYASIGEYQQAFEALERGLKIAPNNCRTRVILSDALILSGNVAKGTALARRIQQESAAGVEELTDCGASASAVLGDENAMFAFLERARDQGDTMDRLLFEPRLVRYHRDPRYRALLEEVGLMPYLADSPWATAQLPAPVPR